MRLLLACLLLVACGSDDHAGAGSSGSGAGGTNAAGHTGGAHASAGAQSAGRSGGDPSAGSSASGRSGAAGSGGASAGASGSAGSTVGKIRLVPNVVAGTQASGTGAGAGPIAEALRIGSPTGTTLMSLKYYIYSIQLCEDLDQAGSGFSNPRGCIALYQNQDQSSPDYNTYMVSAAKDDSTPGRYIDLMSAEGQAALRHPVTIEVPLVAAGMSDADGGIDDTQARVFRYGLINFYRPIKVAAQFPIIGQPGQYFRTRADTAVHDTPIMGSMLGSERVDIGDTLSGPTEETTYMLDNGGALFTFQKPFVITQADIAAQTEISVDLVFNPDNFGQAYDSDCANDTHAAVCDPVNHVAIDMPFVRMNPVPRKAGEHTRKETYLVDYDASAQLRVELYYNDADAEAGVQGVDIALVYGPNAANANAPSGNTIASNFVSQTGSVRTSDATLSLLDYRHMSNLDGLRRRQAGNVTIHCLFTGSICSSLGADLSRAYTYVGDTLVSGN
jgi:hypothetical protein